jgi:polyribonucleotide nucleotidyltransferase
MDAGVPIKAPVAGVAMGLISDENGRFAVLTDIQGIEDHLGDMDFKVAGSSKGITALQVDIKMTGLAYEVMEKALAQALDGRLFILDRMLGTIQGSRPELSQYAPRVYKSKIPVDRIGQLIGPGGKTIRGLQEEHSVKIDVEEDGTVYISGADPEGAKRALAVVERMGRDIEVGADYLGKVTRITNFGAFVEILPGKDGLVRTSELAEYNITRPEDVVSVGDEIMVRVIEVDSQGRVNLSRRAVLEGTPGRAGGARPPSGPSSGGSGGAPGGGYRGGPGGSGGYRGGPPRSGPPSGQSRPPYNAPRSSSAPQQRGPYDRGPMDRERERERERRLSGNPPPRDNPRPGPAPDSNRW